MYSPDRKQYLEKQLFFLRKMDGYDECQKLLVCDGPCNIHPDDFERIIEVPRSNGFNWSKAWQTGVEASKFDTILYLDSDRIFPKHYLSEIKRAIHNDNGCFAYTPNLFTIEKYPGTEAIEELLKLEPTELMKFANTKGLMFEPRFSKPTHFPGKNAMSGSVAFTKETFKKSGGVDPWYEGHGAFADSDYFMQTYKSGFTFFTLPHIPEFHFGHTKRDSNNNILSDKEIAKQGLNNFIYYCNKWNIGFEKPVVVARNIGIESPSSYVQKILEEQNEQKGSN